METFHHYIDYNQSTCRIVEPRPQRVHRWHKSCTWGTFWKKKQKDYRNQRNRKSAMSSCLLGLSEASSVKCHQHGCLTLSLTAMILIDTWMGESSWDHTPYLSIGRTARVTTFWGHSEHLLAASAVTWGEPLLGPFKPNDTVTRSRSCSFCYSGKGTFGGGAYEKLHRGL